VKIFLCLFVAPECVNVDNGKCGILFLGDFNLHGVTLIMNEIMAVKNILPVLSPSFSIETA
jgi:hypothetical protein